MGLRRCHLGEVLIKRFVDMAPPIVHLTVHIVNRGIGDTIVPLDVLLAGLSWQGGTSNPSVRLLSVAVMGNRIGTVNGGPDYDVTGTLNGTTWTPNVSIPFSGIDTGNNTVDYQQRDDGITIQRGTISINVQYAPFNITIPMIQPSFVFPVSGIQAPPTASAGTLELQGSLGRLTFMMNDLPSGGTVITIPERANPPVGESGTSVITILAVSNVITNASGTLVDGIVGIEGGPVVPGRILTSGGVSFTLDSQGNYTVSGTGTATFRGLQRVSSSGAGTNTTNGRIQEDIVLQVIAPSPEPSEVDATEQPRDQTSAVLIASFLVGILAIFVLISFMNGR